MISKAVTKDCVDCEDCTDKSPLFHLLTSEELKLMNTNRYSVRFKAGEVILKQGITSTHIISLVHGSAKIYIEGYNDRNLLLSVIKPWNIIGGPGVHTDNKNHYTVVALEESTVCFIDAKNYKEVMRMNCRFSDAFIVNISRKSIFLFDKLVSLTQKQMHGRMADGLLYLAESIYDNYQFITLLSRQDLADLTAMSKDSAIRILKEFERDEVIRVNGNQFKIINPAQLKEISLKG